MDRTNHTARKSVRASVSIILVLGLAGLLFTANARLAKGNDDRHPDNLAELVQVEGERVAELQTSVDNLQDTVDKLADQRNATTTDFDPVTDELTSVAAGATAVAGPGLIVELSDAPADQVSGEIHPDDLVVHQQDLEAVINALWAGGAEAMTLQDQRVLSTTAFRCVGNVLSLHGRVYSPPYRVQAIGDPDQLRAALDASSRIAIYRDWVDAVGLGWSVEQAEDLELPSGSKDLSYAKVPDDVAIFP